MKGLLFTEQHVKKCAPGHPVKEKLEYLLHRLCEGVREHILFAELVMDAYEEQFNN